MAAFNVSAGRPDPGREYLHQRSARAYMELVIYNLSHTERTEDFGRDV